MVERKINTRASMVSQVQMPQRADNGLPISFTNLDDPPNQNPGNLDFMPDQVPNHIDPKPDEPEEDEDERPGDPDGDHFLNAILHDMNVAYLKLKVYAANRKNKNG